MNLDCLGILIDLYILEQVLPGTSSVVGRIDSRVQFYELYLHSMNLDCLSILIDLYILEQVLPGTSSVVGKIDSRV